MFKGESMDPIPAGTIIPSTLISQPLRQLIPTRANVSSLLTEQIIPNLDYPNPVFTEQRIRSVSNLTARGLVQNLE